MGNRTFKKMSDKNIEYILSAWATGSTVLQIARKMNVSEAAIRYRLIQAEVYPRKKEPEAK